MDIVAVSGKLRTNVGKRASAQIRREGGIPCVMYDANNVIHFTSELKEVKKLIYTPKFKLAEVTIDGKTYKCIIKEYQMHPVTDAITHIDFLHLLEGQAVKIEVPVKFIGTSPGVKSGGKLLQMLRRVKLKTTVEHLIDEVTLDISNLKLGHSIRIRDIQPNEGVEIMNNGATPVAIVEIPRALRSAQSAAEEAGTAEVAE
ncbi:MAG: 50S ribosomal protein L25/general stress protein Ctc [Saprospiraceae bacterium]